MIRILLADDSAVVRAVLRDIFRAAGDITIAGEATNGREAVEMVESLRPDLIVMDILMPVMDGLAAIEEIMAQAPTPILVLSATVDERQVTDAFSAIRKGALDVMEKPPGVGFDVGPQAGFARRIVDKVRLLARIRVIHHPRRRPVPAPVPCMTVSQVGGRDILAIGASTGGPKAVMGILKSLPADLRAAVFVVQHISPGFTRGFAQWLDMECGITVKVAAEGDVIENGRVLVAPDDCHMVIEQGCIRLVPGEPVNSCRPSIDVFFTSLAAAAGERTVAVLLTGMGKDGAQGMLKIRQAKGMTIIQDEQSCAVFGMPKAALALDAVDQILSLERIPEEIGRILR